MDYTSFAPGPSNNLKTPPSPLAPKIFTHKFIGVLLIIIALGAGASYGVWWWGNQQAAQEVVPTFTPRPDETADWKTYTNTQYGISFQYPSHLILVDSPFGDRLAMGIPWEVAFYNQGSQQVLYYFEITNTTTMAAMLASRKTNMISDMTLGGQPAKKDIIPASKDGDGSMEEVYTTISSGMFYASSSIGEDLTFNQILSTLKFTDSADTSTWKTYTNTQYGFEVKYPIDYRVNPYGQPTEKGLAVKFVQTGPEGTDLPSFFIWVITSTLSPDAWLKTTAASKIIGDMTYYRISTYAIGHRTIVDASPTELGTYARVFSEADRIVVFAGVPGTIDPAPFVIQSFKFTK